MLIRKKPLRGREERHRKFIQRTVMEPPPCAGDPKVSKTGKIPISWESHFGKETINKQAMLVTNIKF